MHGSQAIAAIEAQNERTLERVAQFRVDYADGRATFDDFSKLKHEFPYIGFVPCSAGGIDFVIFHANDDIVGWEYLWFGDDHYERDIVGQWIAWCRAAERGAVLDIGGYTGLMSVLAAKANPNLRVHLFEPMARTVERAKINVYANYVRSQVKLHNKAASDVAGEAKINLYRNEDFLGTGNSIYDKKLEIRDVKIIETVRVDDLLPAAHPSVVKVDVEGHELSCLRGMEAMVKRSRPQMVVEVWEHTRDDVLALLRTWGYECVPFEDPGGRVVNYACTPA